MKFKLLHIRYRFLFQVFLLSLYIAIFAFTVVKLAKHLNTFQATEDRISALDNMISESKAVYMVFLNTYSESERFYREGENVQTLKFQSTLTALKDSLRILSDNPRIMEKMKEAGRLDSMRRTIDLLGSNFTRTALTIRELGSSTSGKTGTLTQASTNLVDWIQQNNIPGLSGSIPRLKNLENNFVKSPNPVSYNALITLVNQLPDRIISEEKLDLKSQLFQLTKEYSTAAEQVSDVANRLGSFENSGTLLGEMQQSYNAMAFELRKLSQFWQELKGRLQLKSIIISGLILLILAIAYVIVLILLYKRIKTPLIESVAYAYNLSKGKLNIPDLPLDFAKEFQDLHNSLNTLRASIQDKKIFVEALLKQKFNTDLQLQGKNDTFGKTLIALKENMKKARDEQNRYATENQVRRYQNEGIAKFSDILRSNSDNLEKLADIFIKEIVRYLNAIQGGLFLLDDENDSVLHMKAAFAYNRKKYLTRSINIGEGLVGTCAIEKKSINLTEIPEDYIEITSGLGEALPNNLLLLPVMHEGVLIGVLELASLTPFNNDQLILGEKVTESLASSIINARVNTRTSELLTKSQQQAAEMAEQEEEMRQNMEELKATQEESSRREEELEGFLQAIDQAFYVIEYDIEGVITKVNQRFLYLLNLKVDKVIGKKHIELFGKTSKADSLFFASITEGKTIELAERVEINKKYLEIKNTFTPVKDKSGDTTKILNIMTVIM